MHYTEEKIRIVEPHPVPKNILEVEFQLFGSFTLNQFARILFGSLFALVVFFLPFPALLKYPIMGISVIIGLATALVPGLEVKLWGLLKSLFISPRYVWVKTATAPELLTTQSAKKITQRQNVSKSKSSQSSNLKEISLSKLLNSNTNTAGQSRQYPTERIDTSDRTLLDQRGEVREDNLDTLYNNLYKKSLKKRKEAQQKSKNHQLNVQKNTQQVVSSPKQKININDKKQVAQEIQRLKVELSKVVKDQNYKEKEAAILHEINDLYAQLKNLQSIEQEQFKQNQTIRDFKGKRVGPGQLVFGITVDKKDQFIQNAKVIFKDQNSGETVEAFSGRDGRFATSEKLINGMYDVQVFHPDYKFHTYQVEVGNQKLPAYKFRVR